jgi:transcriptional regulator with XRE-family HTH domain
MLYIATQLCHDKEVVVSKGAKFFAERLNRCLDDTGAPPQVRERAVILGKMLDISKQQAWNLLEGLQAPNQELLQRIAHEFEVDPDWLIGEK